jgi:hypothetical protein
VSTAVFSTNFPSPARAAAEAEIYGQFFWQAHAAPKMVNE